MAQPIAETRFVNSTNQPNLAPQSRWSRTLYIMFFAQLFTAVGFSSIFPFLPLYVEQLGSSAGMSLELLAGLVFSAQAFTMMLASPVWGALADRHGRKLMVERAMFGGALILLLMAFVRSAEELVLLRAVQGFITGSVAATNALVAATVPRERSGYAMGMLQVGLGIGISVGPLIGGAIADRFGYSAAFYVTSGLLLISGITVLIGVEEDFVPLDTLTGGHRSFVARWRQILSRPGVGVSYSLRFMVQLGRTMIIPLMPLFIHEILRDSSLVNTITGLVIGVAAATTTISASYLGRLGDRIGHKRIVIFSCIIAAGLYSFQSMVQASWQLLLLQALIGAALGGIIPSISALLARFSKSGEEGAVYGLDNSIRAGARSIAPLIGSGVAMIFNLRAAFLATGGLFLLTSLLATWRLPKNNPELELATEA